MILYQKTTNYYYLPDASFHVTFEWLVAELPANQKANLKILANYYGFLGRNF